MVTLTYRTAEYTAMAENFLAGCHLINWPEIESAARLAGVADMPADDSAVCERA